MQSPAVKLGVFMASRLVVLKIEMRGEFDLEIKGHRTYDLQQSPSFFMLLFHCNCHNNIKTDIVFLNT